MKKPKILREDVKVINIGLKSFYDNLNSLKIPSIHVDWSPPAGGNKKLLNMLSKLK